MGTKADHVMVDMSFRSVVELLSSTIFKYMLPLESSSLLVGPHHTLGARDVSSGLLTRWIAINIHWLPNPKIDRIKTTKSLRALRVGISIMLLSLFNISFLILIDQ